MYVYVYLTLILCAGCAFVNSEISLEEAKAQFEEFIIEYDRSYKSEEEKQMRFEIFMENLREIKKGNLREGSEVMGINLFSDISKEEFKETNLGCYIANLTDSCERYNGGFLGYAPESFDWREKGVVTPVKRQWTCGACWAFSSVGNVESQYALKYNELLDLSEQQEVDCNMDNKGCEGGSVMQSLQNLNLVGLMEEADYPFKARQTSCKYDPDKVKVKVTGCIDFTGASEEEIKELLVRFGPLTVALPGIAMKDYRKGVYTKCEEYIDHALLLVGYGTDPETYQPYWILKNSWSKGFGENGYIRLHRGIPECHVGLHQLATAQVA